MKTAMKEPVRQATLSDLPRLVEMADLVTAPPVEFDGEKGAWEYLEGLILDENVTVFISDAGFWYGFLFGDITDPRQTIATVVPHAVKASFWKEVAWTAEATAESIGAYEMRISVPFKETGPMKLYTALGFEGLSALFSRPIVTAGNNIRKIEQ